MMVTPGLRLSSAVCTTEIIVVRAPAAEVDLRCGGVTLLDHGAGSPGHRVPEPGMDTGTLLGKRYADPDLGLEVLCTKAGSGTLAVGGSPLPVKSATPLPSSD